MVEVSIIIVNYKSWKHLENCLNSIETVNTYSDSYEIIVVDNFSNDGVLHSFKRKFATVQFIENSGNNGFANGCNLGAKRSVGNYLMFLNPDTFLSENTIYQLIETAKANSNYGILSCKTVNLKGKIENEIRFFPTLKALFGGFRAIYKWINSGKLNAEFNSSKKIVFPDWVSGSLIFISRSWFNRVHGWNEDYWMYFEDIDICKKIADLGGRIALIRTTSIIHNHGGATRLNLKTAATTKTEVLISKHVYVQNNFKGFDKTIGQILLVIQNIFTILIFAIIGLIFFFIPKLKLNFFLFKNILIYYLSSFKNKSWLSKRSRNKKP